MREQRFLYVEVSKALQSDKIEIGCSTTDKFAPDLKG
jgi:hypothetical protein